MMLTVEHPLSTHPSMRGHDDSCPKKSDSVKIFAAANANRIYLLAHLELSEAVTDGEHAEE